MTHLKKLCILECRPVFKFSRTVHYRRKKYLLRRRRWHHSSSRVHRLSTPLRARGLWRATRGRGGHRHYSVNPWVSTPRHLRLRSGRPKVRYEHVDWRRDGVRFTKQEQSDNDRHGRRVKSMSSRLTPSDGREYQGTDTGDVNLHHVLPDS